MLIAHKSSEKLFEFTQVSREDSLNNLCLTSPDPCASEVLSVSSVHHPTPVASNRCIPSKNVEEYVAEINGNALLIRVVKDKCKVLNETPEVEVKTCVVQSQTQHHCGCKNCLCADCSQDR